MSTAETVVSVPAAIAAPTDRQMARLTELGVTTVPQDLSRAQASALISAAIAERDMRPATDKQRGRAGVLGGRDLPGAGVRELSTQIALLEALAVFAASGSADPAGIRLAQAVRERLCRPVVARSN